MNIQLLRWNLEMHSLLNLYTYLLDILSPRLSIGKSFTMLYRPQVGWLKKLAAG